MMLLPYSFNISIQSLIRDKWINLLSMLTIATGLLIISLAFLSAYNIDMATQKLPEKFTMLVYLEDNLPKEKLESAMNSIKKNSAVFSVKYIPKEDAMKELKATLKNSNYIFEGLEENPLPDSLELRLRKDAVGPETAKRISEEVLKIKGVSEVDYGESFLSTIHYLRIGLQIIGIVLTIILCTGIIFVCYSTVKMLFYRRKEEFETFKLLGATRGFIRMPFIIEGAVIGVGGGLLSLLGIAAFYYMVILKFSVTIPVFKMILFPADVFLTLPLWGMLLGIFGATLALGRLKY
jgi:cell division transport system permease protein